MLRYLYLEVDMLAMAMLIILMIALTNKNAGRHENDQKLFMALLMSNVLLLIMDASAWFLNGSAIPRIHAVLVFINWVYFALNGTTSMLWLMYCDYVMNHDIAHLKKRIPLYSIPCAVIIVGITISLFNGCVFYIDENNLYVRGWLTTLMTVSYVYFVWSTILILRRKKADGGTRENSVYTSLLFFPVPPLIGSVIQLLNLGLTLIWTVSSVSFLIVYLNIQNNQISRDPLTGAFNRGKIDSYLAWQMRMLSSGNGKGNHLFAMMLDINKFKSINDEFGHLTGDIALIQTAELIRTEVKEDNDLVGRLGGDEFLIIGIRDRLEEIEETKERIIERFDRFNRESGLQYSLMPSVGYSVLGQDDARDVDTMLNIADKKMYIEKQKTNSER